MPRHLLGFSANNYHENTPNKISLLPPPPRIRGRNFTHPCPAMIVTYQFMGQLRAEGCFP